MEISGSASHGAVEGGTSGKATMQWHGRVFYPPAHSRVPTQPVLQFAWERERDSCTLIIMER